MAGLASSELGTNPFSGSREAKDFLVSRIAAEAQREGVPLSDVERKMLYFSETAWTLPDMMQIFEEFDREYDRITYERKITRLIRNAAQHDRGESLSQYETWLSAIRLLKREDHYILVMIQQAGLRPPGDLLKLWGTGLAVVIVGTAAIFAASAAADRYRIDFGRYIPSVDAVLFYVWVAAAFIVLLVFLLWHNTSTQQLVRRSISLLRRVFGGRGL